MVLDLLPIALFQYCESPCISQIGARIEGWDRELDSMFFRSPSTPDSEAALSNPKLRDVMARTQKKEKYMQKDAEVVHWMTLEHWRLTVYLHAKVFYFDARSFVVSL